MKRNLFTLGLLSLVALGLLTSEAPAYWWRFCCCKSPCCTITIKPYNAFSPVCCGSSVLYGGCPQSSWTPTTAWTPDYGIPAPPADSEVRVPNGVPVHVNPITTYQGGYYGQPTQPSTYPQPFQPYTTQPGAYQTYHHGAWPQAAPVPNYWHKY